MAKFYGVVGYGESVEQPEDSGLWVDVIDEVLYFGDILNNNRDLRYNDDGVVGDITPSVRISLIADQYANEHFSAIKFVEWAGSVWTVTKVEVHPPRLTLSLGNVYTGPRMSGA